MVRRLRDWENLYTKHLTDGLVACGICPDDSPVEMPEAPRVTQTLVGPGEEERVVIVVEELAP